MSSLEAESTLIGQILGEIAELLPEQGPIDVFIHHNTLHAFENVPFEVAVKEAAKVYGAEAFLPEQRYLEEFRSGRISESDIDAVLSEQGVDDLDLAKHSFRDILKHFLLTSPPVEGFQEVKWLLREARSRICPQNIPVKKLQAWCNRHVDCVDQGNALHRLNLDAAEGLRDIIRTLPRDDRLANSEAVVLWAAALLLAADIWPAAASSSPVIEQAALLDELCNPILIRFCEEYLDLGFSNQLMPGRSQGMLDCFLRLIESAHFGIPVWLQAARKDLARYRVPASGVEDLLSELLSECQLSPPEYREFLLREALSLRGWAGYVALVEHRPDLLHGQEFEIRPRLIDYLVIRLILRKYVAQSHLYHSRLAELLPNSPELRAVDEVYCFAYHILLLLTSLGIGDLLLDDQSAMPTLVSRLQAVDHLERRRLWHLAYEHNLYQRTLDALAHHRTSASATRQKPSAQFIFCIDDREESIRRHLEAQSNRYETYGTAGFFGIDANYTVLSGATAPYCPVIIKPRHAIREVPREGYENHLLRFQKKQKVWFKLSGFVNRGSGSIVHNLLLSLGGCLSLIPMVLGVISPRTLRFMERAFGSEPQLPADLHELQVVAQPGQDTALPGYTPEEMAARVTSVLRGIGLVRDFADLIMLVGHGSSSRNNPLRSAYDCGACGGRPGRINARAFCLMANDAEVRRLVAHQSGIVIPERTFFLGAFHNTCSDQIEYFDLDCVPEALRELLRHVQDDVRAATKQNALERCRRFVQAGVRDLDRAAEEAIARSYMLAEARPEYGHATNAICIVGPRHYTKGLFLDRRSFLVSYDAAIDHDATILLGLLRAVVPVCGGINLEYLFSAIDNEVYGAGTKLPHNVVSLVGVMNGTSSDLRTGLPAQMVEIHEPVRLLLVIVSTRGQLEKTVSADAGIRRSFEGGWIRVVLSDADSGQLAWRLPDGTYKPFTPSDEPLPTVSDYRDWFLGKSGHLPFAQLRQREG